jgi:hypothetical protein
MISKIICLELGQNYLHTRSVVEVDPIKKEITEISVRFIKTSTGIYTRSQKPCWFKMLDEIVSNYISDNPDVFLDIYES